MKHPCPLRFVLIAFLAASTVGVASAQQGTTGKTYALVIADRTGKLGPALRPARATCAERQAKDATQGKPFNEVPFCGELPRNSGYIEGRGLTIDELAAVLSRITGTTVVNKTGLSGTYDWDLAYAPEGRDRRIHPLIDDVFAEVQRWLGLRLVPETAPVANDASASKSGGLVQPVALVRGKPMYTPEAMRRHIQGTVTVTCIVQPSGSCTDIEVLRSLDPIFGLDEQAVESVGEWRFKPATNEGVPVPLRITVEVVFTLGS